MTDSIFLPKPYSTTLVKGSFTYRAPSNIALVKYWGKHGMQLPKNTSISFTLTNCFTNTTLHYTKKEDTTVNDLDFEVFLDGRRELGFEPKIAQFLERIGVYLPFLKNYKFRIETSNSFPHSSGIASSASGMSALALCLVDMENQMLGNSMNQSDFNQKASFLARLGSGSACRSIEGSLIVWGEHAAIEGSSNLFGSKYSLNVHPNFNNYQDTILLVDKGEKQVSSTVGHELMHGHPFASSRFEQANDNISKLIPILQEGDLSSFINIVESEALSLHAMMMTSMPYFVLMKPNTLEIINRIWAFRKKTGSNVCFTLDAGANVHVLYPENEKELVLEFIQNELSLFCKNREFIVDCIGSGAQKV